MGAPRVPDAGSARTVAGAPLASGAMVAEPGWHLDPYSPTSGRERFWDGAAWTPRLRHGSVFPGRTVLLHWSHDPRFQDSRIRDSRIRDSRSVIRD